MEGVHSAAEQCRAKVGREERREGPALAAEESPEQLFKTAKQTINPKKAAL